MNGGRTLRRHRALGLALAGLLAACAPAGGPGRRGSPSATAALARVERVRLEVSSAVLGDEAVARLKAGGGPGLASSSERDAPVLRLRLECGGSFDLFRPDPPINAPSANMSPEDIASMHAYSTGMLPECEGRAELRVDGRTVWSEARHAAVKDEASARTLTDLLVGRFLDDWRNARSGAGPAGVSR